MRQAVPGQMLRSICLRGACAVSLVSSPPGRLRDPPWGHYGPCARCSLTAPVHRGDTQARTGAEANAKSIRREPQQSVERRAGSRHGPVISGDPEMDPTARRVTGCGVSAPAPVGALLPSIFLGAETDKGIPAPLKPGGEALAD